MMLRLEPKSVSKINKGRKNNLGEKSMCGKTYKFCVKSVLTKIDSIELPDFEFCALLGCVTGTTDGGTVVAE